MRVPPGRRATLRHGLFIAGSSAAEAEGTFQVVARLGRLADQVDVTVAPVDLRDLTAAEEPSDTSGRGASQSNARSTSGLGVNTKGEPATTTLVLIGLATMTLSLLAFGVLVLARRGRRADRAGEPADVEEQPTDDSPRPASPTSAPSLCPVCQSEYGDRTLKYCPKDGAELAFGAVPPTAHALICPSCRRGFASNVKQCPKDGDDLVPYLLFVEEKRLHEAADRRICPSCGASYHGQTRFCGKDGAELVQVN